MHTFNRPKPKSLAQLTKQCERWNRKHPIGTAVCLQRDDGTIFTTRTRAEADVLSGHTAVIWVEGITGCYLLDRVEPA